MSSFFFLLSYRGFICVVLSLFLFWILFFMLSSASSSRLSPSSSPAVLFSPFSWWVQQQQHMEGETAGVNHQHHNNKKNKKKKSTAVFPRTNQKEREDNVNDCSNTADDHDVDDDKDWLLYASCFVQIYRGSAIPPPLSELLTQQQHYHLPISHDSLLGSSSGDCSGNSRATSSTTTSSSTIISSSSSSSTSFQEHQPSSKPDYYSYDYNTLQRTIQQYDTIYFIGDSILSQQYQSLLCLLQQQPQQHQQSSSLHDRNNSSRSGSSSLTQSDILMTGNSKKTRFYYNYTYYHVHDDNDDVSPNHDEDDENHHHVHNPPRQQKRTTRLLYIKYGYKFDPMENVLYHGDFHQIIHNRPSKYTTTSQQAQPQRTTTTSTSTTKAKKKRKKHVAVVLNAGAHYESYQAHKMLAALVFIAQQSMYTITDGVDDDSRSNSNPILRDGINNNSNNTNEINNKKKKKKNIIEDNDNNNNNQNNYYDEEQMEEQQSPPKSSIISIYYMEPTNEEWPTYNGMYRKGIEKWNNISCQAVLWNVLWNQSGTHRPMSNNNSNSSIDQEEQEQHRSQPIQHYKIRHKIIKKKTTYSTSTTSSLLKTKAELRIRNISDAESVFRDLLYPDQWPPIGIIRSRSTSTTTTASSIASTSSATTNHEDDPTCLNPNSTMLNHCVPYSWRYDLVHYVFNHVQHHVHIVPIYDKLVQFGISTSIQQQNLLSRSKWSNGRHIVTSSSDCTHKNPQTLQWMNQQLIHVMMMNNT